MSELQPRSYGEFASHPAAVGLLREVVRVHRRYASEVVAAFGLCPFLKDIDSGFGTFCVFFDSKLCLSHVQDAVRALGTSVSHLIFPCVQVDFHGLDRFAKELHKTISQPGGPVYAVFHPTFPGQQDTPHRLTGLLRRAPDPFLQLVPPGLGQSSTVFWDPSKGELPPLEPSNAERNFARLQGDDLARVLSLLEEIRVDRDQSYAPFLAELTTASQDERSAPPAMAEAPLSTKIVAS